MTNKKESQMKTVPCPKCGEEISPAQLLGRMSAAKKPREHYVMMARARWDKKKNN